MEINENKSSNINNYGQIGWVCPLCGHVWSPYVRECTCNRFYDSSHITCQSENKNGSKSIFEGQMNHIPQIDSNFNDFEPQNEEKLVSHVLEGETLDTIAIFAPETMNDDPKKEQKILNDMKNPLAGCKQVESGGYILDGPPKNNIVPIDIKKKGKNNETS